MTTDLNAAAEAAGELIELAPAPLDKSPEGWVVYAANAALHAMRAARAARLAEESGDEPGAGDEPEAGFTAEEFAGVGRRTYLSHLPMLTTRDSIRTYIAGVAAGVPLGVINADEAGKLLYVAQTALSAARSAR